MNQTNASPRIRIQGVHKVFKTDDREVVALKDINLDIPDGQFVCLLGPSGCGKSTLLNAIAGFALPSSGQILTDDKVVSEPGPDRGCNPATWCSTTPCAAASRTSASTWRRQVHPLPLGRRPGAHREHGRVLLFNARWSVPDKSSSTHPAIRGAAVRSRKANDTALQLNQ